jgi:ADP-ribose pyrophosphatase YjhB (NUDIX family)
MGGVEEGGEEYEGVWAIVGGRLLNIYGLRM